jgi:hypothetical protein
VNQFRPRPRAGFARIRGRRAHSENLVVLMNNSCLKVGAFPCYSPCYCLVLHLCWLVCRPDFQQVVCWCNCLLYRHFQEPPVGPQMAAQHPEAHLEMFVYSCQIGRSCRNTGFQSSFLHTCGRTTGPFHISADSSWCHEDRSGISGNIGGRRAGFPSTSSHNLRHRIASPLGM